MSIGADTLAALSAAGLDAEAIQMQIANAIIEDLGGGLDVTSFATIEDSAQARGFIATRAYGVIAGAHVAAAVFELLGVSTQVLREDGSVVEPGDKVVAVVGPTRAMLTAERTALNFISHLSGIATQTSKWVAALEGSKARILDTRKTTPGLRALEKFAVRCGGGVNHRMGLSDMALIKDNHIVAAGSVTAAFDAVRKQFPDLRIEVECDTFVQVKEAVEAGATMVLLDNMTPEELRECVSWVDGRATCEASGGLSLETARAVAASGVDFLSNGGLTNSAPILDLGLDLVSGGTS